MNADRMFLIIVGAIGVVWLAVWAHEVRAEGFQPQYVEPVQVYNGGYYQQPAQRARREERRTQRHEQERYEDQQQPIVGGQNSQVWDTNPKQINGGQGNGQR